MSEYFLLEGLDILQDIGEGLLVALGEFFNALGEALANALHFVIDIGLEGGHPFVLDGEGLDFGGGEGMVLFE